MNEPDELREEYGDRLREGTRGKYYQEPKEGVRTILLDSDVAEVFTDAKQINSILRALIPAVKKQAS